MIWRNSADALALVSTELKFGVGSFAQAGRLARRLGRRALVVMTRSAMERLGYAQELMANLRRHGIEAQCFKEFRPSPTTDDIDHGAVVARKLGADMIISLGGGSAIDCGKAVAAVAAADRRAYDYLYRLASVPTNSLPLIAIPTTAGTGSEMNRSAIVTDPQRPFKDGIRSPHLLPRYAIVDPSLTRGASKELMAQTGFDVLAHAIESYVSPMAQPVTDGLALEAIRTVGQFLPILLASPEDATARKQLALASTMMGINLACVGTCFPHRADKSLCALHPEIPHGQSVALFYPWWVRSCCRMNIVRFARITENLRPSLSHLSADSKADRCAEVVTEFLAGIGLLRDMADLGVTTAEIPRLVVNIPGDLSLNPIAMDRNSLAEVFQELLAENRPTTRRKPNHDSADLAITAP